MAIKFSGTNQSVYNANGAGVLSGTAHSIALRFNVTTRPASGGAILANLGYNVSGTTNDYLLSLEVDFVSSGVAYLTLFSRFDASSPFFGEWQYQTNLTTGQWYNCALTYDHSSASNNPRIWLDGTEVTLVRVSTPAGTFNATTMDSFILGEGTDFLSDAAVEVAEVAFWPSALGVGQAIALSSGAPPTEIGVKPAVYLPFVGDNRELIGRVALTVRGSPTYTAHPRVWYPAPPFIGAVQTLGLADLAKTEADDTVAATASVLDLADAAKTQGSQTLAGTSSVLDLAALTKTQAAQTIAATASVLDLASFAKTQASQTLTATSTEAVVSSAAVTQAGNTIAATSSVLDVADLAKTQAAQTIAARASVAVVSAAALTQAGETLVAATGASLVASAALTQAGETLSAAASLVDVSAAALTQSDQTLSATASVEDVVSATPTQASNTLVAAGSVLVQTAAAIDQAPQTLASASGVEVVAALSETQDAETLAADSVAVIPGGVSADLDLSQADQTLVAAGVLAVVSAVLASQDAQTLSADSETAAAGDVTSDLVATQAGQTLAAVSTSDAPVIVPEVPSQGANGRPRDFRPLIQLPARHSRLVAVQQDQTLVATSTVEDDELEILLMLAA